MTSAHGPLARFARRHAGRLRPALWVAALACVPFAVHAWGAGFPGRESAEVQLRLAVSIALLALLASGLLPVDSPFQRRWRPVCLVLTAALATATYFNAGRFHGFGFVHHWEQFHYSLNARYYPELGHDGLYVASLEAQQQRAPGRPLQPHVRDLRTNVVVPTDSAAIAAHRAEVRARFTPERWAAFVIDNQHFVEANSDAYMRKIRLDHGFNPPPSWTFVARSFVGDAELDLATLRWLGSIDVALLALMFALVFRTYGLTVGCLALTVFGLNYAGRFYWVGGAFLREDWLAAVGIGACFLKRARFAAAGACLAYAASVRLFPVLLLLGLGPALLGRIVRGGGRQATARVAVGFAAGALAMFALGCLAGRGVDGWLEFLDTIRLHGRTWLTNNVGLENVVLYGPDDFRRTLVDFSLPEPWIRWQPHMDAVRAARLPLTWAARLAMLALLGLAAWRARPDHALLLGLAGVYALALTTCYYWQALALLPLLGSARITWSVLLLGACMHALHFTSGAFELRYGLMSWALLALFVAILAPRAVATLKRY